MGAWEMGRELGTGWHPLLTRLGLILAKLSGFFKATPDSLGIGCSHPQEEGGRGSSPSYRRDNRGQRGTPSDE